MGDSALPKPPISLLRFLCNGGLQRRHASQALTLSKVFVNGEVSCCGSSLVYSEDSVTVDGQNIPAFNSSDAVAVVYNKPCGIEIGLPRKLCTRDGSSSSFEAVLQKLASDLHVPRLFAIGRLDKETSGLLLITNDGTLSSACRYPGLLTKTYIVTSNLRRAFKSPETFEQVARTEEARAQSYCARLTSAPIVLSDGPVEFTDAACIFMRSRLQRVPGQHLSARRSAQPAQFTAGHDCDSAPDDLLLCVVELKVRVTLKIGRFRVVRRAVAAAGLPVCALHRCCFGPIELLDPEHGNYDDLTDDSLRISVPVGCHALLSRSDLLRLWQHMFGARGRDCMADQRVEALRRLCAARCSREFDDRLLAWLRCNEMKFVAPLSSAGDQGGSSDDQD